MVSQSHSDSTPLGHDSKSLKKRFEAIADSDPLVVLAVKVSHALNDAVNIAFLTNQL
jgi:hypothetical protein